MEKRIAIALYGTLPIIFVMTGCATIIHGTHQDLSFQSNPDGATVTVGGRVIGKRQLLPH
jgi:hypothetical protein